MKNKRLIHIIGMIDENIIEEAAPKAKAQSTNRIKWVAACFMVVIISITMLLWIFKSPEIEVADNIKYYSSDNLEVIPCSFYSADMGGGGGFGHLIVKDFSETCSDNPTLNNVESITELPVFVNEEGLWSDYYRELEDLDDLIYFNSPTTEETYSYSYYGDASNTWNVCYQYDSEKSLVDQLLDYSFHRIYYTVYFELSSNISWARILSPPLEAGILYPIISLEEAEAKLRNNDFFCYGDEEAVAETAEILSVEIVYLTHEEQSYLQPFYMFYITDASWDVSNVMECDNEDEFFSVSPVYIPALQEEYLEMTEPTVIYN